MNVQATKGSIIILLLLPGVLLFLAPLIDFPYGYYTFLRIFITLTAIYYIVSSYIINQGLGVPSTIFVLIVILYNPIFPVHLSREIWMPINFITAGYYFWMFYNTINILKRY